MVVVVVAVVAVVVVAVMRICCGVMEASNGMGSGQAAQAKQNHSSSTFNGRFW